MATSACFDLCSIELVLESPPRRDRASRTREELDSHVQRAQSLALLNGSRGVMRKSNRNQIMIDSLQASRLDLVLFLVVFSSERSIMACDVKYRTVIRHSLRS